MPEKFSLSSVQVVQKPLDRFEEYLQRKRMRNTRQRRMIVEQVFRQHEHFDADDLIASLALAVGQRKISRPTVYRTLAEMVEAGLLRRMHLGGRGVFEHDYGYPQHDHLHCQRCNKLIEFHSDQLQEIRDAVARQHGFCVVGHRLIIGGICRQCRRPRRRRAAHRDST
ncbi:MAG: transcriptional repressor [Planctomycetes bacterium RBG_16_64_10]|nr:MAG: transcriptional repressor [Planctomycetes bacterium RBG_16_64_10]